MIQLEAEVLPARFLGQKRGAGEIKRKVGKVELNLAVVKAVCAEPLVWVRSRVSVGWRSHCTIKPKRHNAATRICAVTYPCRERLVFG